ncbi:hypothetical protein ACFPFX_10925 [Streptomyces mauvecolor]|uniref:Uncharacterized protein n=1 Tax=Streptomyces mauvecolor TaxID=58345 RepID=A0ABV9UKP9_9ACTN
MPDITQPHHPDAAHHILNRAHDLLDAAGEQESPSFAQLLTRAADQLRADGCLDLDLHGLAQAVTEAAAQLVACTHIPLQKRDPHLEYYLDALDQLPRPARTGLLTAAARHTAPCPEGAPLLDAPPHGRFPARHRITGPCPCGCNSGGCCGGCGHAGCAGRQ